MRTMIMPSRRLTTFLAAAGLFSIASIALAKEKAGTPAKEKAGSGISEYTKGNQLFESKQYEQAVAEFTKAIEANGKQPVFYQNRGFAYIGLEKGPEAAADFSKAIELAPKDERAYIGRAQASLLQKDYQQALADAGKALELKPDNAVAYKFRGDRKSVV